MRGMVAGLGTPYPIGTMLPAILQEDAVAMLLTEALDDVLAPAIGTLDCLHAYLDPRLTPPDFLEWLAGWVGVELNENWPGARQRAIVAAAVELHRARGTVAGLRRYLELATGGTVVIEDSGGAACSESPEGVLPGTAVPRVSVRVSVPAGSEISAEIGRAHV